MDMTYTFTSDNRLVGFDVKAIKSYSLPKTLEIIHDLRLVFCLLLKYFIWLYRTAQLRIYLCDLFVYVIQFLHSIYLFICAYIMVVSTHMHYLHGYVYAHTVQYVRFEGNAFICGISHKIFLQKHKYKEMLLFLKIHEQCLLCPKSVIYINILNMSIMPKICDMHKGSKHVYYAHN